MKVTGVAWLGVLLLGASVARGAVVEVPLDYAGHYEFGDAWTGQFDVGLEFSRIDNVYVEWSGEITGELLEGFGGPDWVRDAAFWLRLYEGDIRFGLAGVRAGEATYPDPEPFDEQTAFEYLNYGRLLDGQAEVQIRLLRPGGGILHTTIEYPFGDLFGASLFIEGAIVPEPVSAVMLICGAGYMATKRPAGSREDS